MGLNDEKRNTFFITLFRVKSCENLRSIFCFTKFTKASVLTPSTKNRPKSLESHHALRVKYRDLSLEVLPKHWTANWFCICSVLLVKKLGFFKMASCC